MAGKAVSFHGTWASSNRHVSKLSAPGENDRRRDGRGRSRSDPLGSAADGRGGGRRDDGPGPCRCGGCRVRSGGEGAPPPVWAPLDSPEPPQVASCSPGAPGRRSPPRGQSRPSWCGGAVHRPPRPVEGKARHGTPLATSWGRWGARTGGGVRQCTVHVPAVRSFGVLRPCRSASGRRRAGRKRTPCGTGEGPGRSAPLTQARGGGSPLTCRT